MSDKIFIDGMFVKAKETAYGEIIKQSIEVETFIAFARQHAKQSQKNGKWYLNIDVLSSQSGGKYAALDTFEPQQQPQRQQQPQYGAQNYQQPQQAPAPQYQAAPQQHQAPQQVQREAPPQLQNMNQAEDDIPF